MEAIDVVLRKLDWMRQERIWPNGLRYLWTDAFGVVVLVSLYRHFGERRWLEEAEWVVAEVRRVLGRERGIRIGEAPDRHGQYYHYLAMWLYALEVLGREIPAYHDEALQLARTIHPAFVIPGQGVIWKMREDLSGPDPQLGGFGALDAYHGYVVYRLIDETALADEIAEMKTIMDRQTPGLHITQDLGLGMMLWFTHFHPEEDWARILQPRALATLDTLWQPQGYFCREPGWTEMRFAFTNYGIAVGLQAIGAWPERVRKLLDYFETWRSGDEYDREAITHVMACAAWYPAGFLREFTSAS